MLAGDQRLEDFMCFCVGFPRSLRDSPSSMCLVPVSGYEIPPKAFPAQGVNRNLAIWSPVCYDEMCNLLDMFQEAGAPSRIVWRRGLATQSTFSRALTTF